jgi:hypothetical protein
MGKVQRRQALLFCVTSLFVTTALPMYMILNKSSICQNEMMVMVLYILKEEFDFPSFDCANIVKFAAVNEILPFNLSQLISAEQVLLQIFIAKFFSFHGFE